MSDHLETIERLKEVTLNGKAPDETLYSKIAYGGRRKWLTDCLIEMKKINPEDASDIEISTTLSILICAGISLGTIKEWMKISKTTIKRWIELEAPPRDIYRPMVITKSILLMEILLDEKEYIVNQF